MADVEGEWSAGVAPARSCSRLPPVSDRGLAWIKHRLPRIPLTVRFRPETKWKESELLLLFRVGAFGSRMGGAETQPHECHSWNRSQSRRVSVLFSQSAFFTYQLLFLQIYTYISKPHCHRNLQRSLMPLVLS